jgi:septation ring formation regulator EzrA
MNDFKSKTEDASARAKRKLGDVADRVEKECTEVIRYMNDEVVPAVRQHSTKALRTAAEKLQELANYMEQHSGTSK